MSANPNVQTVLEAWGAEPPAWVLILAEACDNASQGRVAADLNVSATQVNQVLKNAYKGRLDRIEARVRGELMKETVSCPILGELSKRECLDHQSRGYEATNSTRVRLFQACRKCVHRRDS